MAHKSSPYQAVHLGLVALLAIIMIGNVAMLWSASSSSSKTTSTSTVTGAASSGAKASEPISLLQIVPTNCVQCTDLTDFISQVKSAGVTFSSEKTQSQEESADLIQKLGITRLPALVLTGKSEFLDQASQIFEPTEDGYVYKIVEAPYADLDGSVKGLVTSIQLVDPTCTECQDSSILLTQLKSNGVYFAGSKEIDVRSEEGKRLSARYNVSKVPTVLLSEDAMDYELIKSVWSSVGSTESDGMLVLREVPAPYFDMNAKVVRGLVTAVYLTDSSCRECYNVSLHHDILTQNLAMKFAAETTYDISSTDGKRLVERYNISKVPTFILNSQAQYYGSVKSVWPNVGTIESDGTYVFRELEQLGVAYFDLSTKKFVSATQ